MLCFFLGFYRQVAAPLALLVADKTDAQSYQLLQLKQGKQPTDGGDAQTVNTGKGQRNAHQPQHAAVQKHEEYRVATRPKGGHENHVEQAEGHPDGKQPHHGHRSGRHHGIGQAEQRHHGGGEQGNEGRHQNGQQTRQGEEVSDGALCALQILFAQLLAHQKANSIVHAHNGNVEEAAHRVADFIDLQRRAAQQAVGLHIHGVAQTKHGLVGDEGDHPADDGGQKGQIPVGQLPEGAQKGLFGGKGINNMSNSAAGVGDDGGQCRTGHAHPG